MCPRSSANLFYNSAVLSQCEQALDQLLLASSKNSSCIIVGLPKRIGGQVMDVIAELNAHGTTVIMVCHDMEVVADYARRVIAMTAGQVVADGETFAVLRNRDVLARTHLLPPQVVDVALRLAEDGAVEAASPVALADTLDEMTDALAAAAGACERTGAR